MKKILLFLFLLINVIAVKADSDKGDFYEGEEIRGAYLRVTVDGETIDTKVKFIYKDENQVVYLTNPNHYGLDFSESYSINESTVLSDAQWHSIKEIMYFGYGYEDRTAQKWYFITQMKIWEVMYGYGNVRFIDGIDGNVEDKYYEETEELNTSLSTYAASPKFPTKEINYQVENILIDEKNVLKNHITDTEDVEIKDDQLIIKNKTKNFSIFLSNKGDLYENDPEIYTKDGIEILQPGNYDEVGSTFYFDVIKGSLKINITSETIHCTSCSEGVTYKIYNEQDEVVSEISINETTTINLYPGTFYLKDTSRDLGFIKDENIYEFTITKDQTTEIIINQEKITNTINITKYNNSQKDNTSIFSLYDSNNNHLEDISIINAEATITLGYGDYILKHKSGDANYKLVDDINIKVRTNELVQIKNLVSKSTSDIEIPDTYKNISISTIIILITSYLGYKSYIKYRKDAKKHVNYQ